MSYNEQAEKINKDLKDAFVTMKHPQIEEEGKIKLVNAILWFGQVAKYRCRSNTAYDNFSKLVFDGIAELERKPLEGQEFEILQVK